jgi:hydroxyacyl-ACP dehydratase HTD2-like protein with hotdog domain
VTATPLALDELRGWIGRTESAIDVVSATPARALAATLGLAHRFDDGTVEGYPGLIGHGPLLATLLLDLLLRERPGARE